MKCCLVKANIFVKKEEWEEISTESLSIEKALTTEARETNHCSKLKAYTYGYVNYEAPNDDADDDDLVDDLKEVEDDDDEEPPAQEKAPDYVYLTRYGWSVRMPERYTRDLGV